MEFKTDSKQMASYRNRLCRKMANYCDMASQVNRSRPIRQTDIAQNRKEYARYCAKAEAIFDAIEEFDRMFKMS